MPTYEYACGACGHQWEVVQRITEAPVELCPACAKTEAHRLISRGTNFILKGGGWYSDLYASPKATTQEKSTEKAESGAPSPTQGTKAETGGGEAKAESKAASTPAEAAAPPRPTPPAASS
jgi:putative FmdB family regulatory protein